MAIEQQTEELIVRIIRLAGFVVSMCVMCGGICCPLTSYAASVDRIVAIVNDDIIVLSELDRELKPYREKIKANGYAPNEEKKMLFDMREKLLSVLIDDKLRDQEIAKSEDITVTREEVNGTIEKIKKDGYLTDEELREELEKGGLTMKAYTQQIREQILRGKLMNRKVVQQIIITPEDVRAYYDRHKDKYGGKTQYHLRHILMKKPSLMEDKAQDKVIQEKMDDILEQLNSGASFEALAKAHSESPTGADGGDLGVFGLGSLSDQIKTGIRSLKPGQYSPVIDTDQGYQIFLLQDIIEEPGASLEDATAEIHEALYGEIVEKEYTAWIESLRKQAHIKIIR